MDICRLKNCNWYISRMYCCFFDIWKNSFFRAEAYSSKGDALLCSLPFGRTYAHTEYRTCAKGACAKQIFPLQYKGRPCSCHFKNRSHIQHDASGKKIAASQVLASSHFASATCQMLYFFHMLQLAGPIVHFTQPNTFKKIKLWYF